MDIARITLGAVACVLLLVAGLSKVTGQRSMRDMADHFAIAWPRYRAIGYLELAAVVGIMLGFWWPWLGAAAAVGVVLLMIGALVVHARARDPLTATTPALAVLVSSAGYLVTTLAA